MCHDILKEDEDEAPLPDDNSNDQNGNIEAKLANLSLADTASAVNGNSDKEKTGITKANKKSKAKKGANIVNNNGDTSASASINSANDNNANDSGHADDSSVRKIADANDLIKDDAATVAH